MMKTLSFYFTLASQRHSRRTGPPVAFCSLGPDQDLHLSTLESRERGMGARSLLLEGWTTSVPCKAGMKTGMRAWVDPAVDGPMDRSSTRLLRKGGGLAVEDAATTWNRPHRRTKNTRQKQCPRGGRASPCRAESDGCSVLSCSSRQRSMRHAPLTDARLIPRKGERGQNFSSLITTSISQDETMRQIFTPGRPSSREENDQTNTSIYCNHAITA